MPNTGLMTGAEARKTWCPWARIVTWDSRAPGGGVGSANRLADGTPMGSTHCVASDCAAWRWSHAPGRGYCGAAGPPGANMAGEALN
jgi:hypothetical protein